VKNNKFPEKQHYKERESWVNLLAMNFSDSARTFLLL
jgi:hypothetical protein